MTSSSKNSFSSLQKERIAKKAAHDGLLEFAVTVDPNYYVNWHHKIIGYKLEEVLKRTLAGEKSRIILELPPRHGKSHLATTLFPSWALGKHPNLEFIIASYSADLATDFGAATRDLMDHPNYQEVFQTRLKADTRAKGKWQTDKRGGYTATGVGGSITGKGFNIGIIDDPIKNREEADSQTARESIWNWYRSTFYTRQNGQGAIIVILTRWHTDDLVGRLLRKQKKDEEAGLVNYDKWEVIRFPAIADKDEQYRKEGEALWPARFPLEALENTKNQIGLYEWTALYQQSPIASENQEFKPVWFHNRDWNEVERTQTRNYLTIDTAVSQRASANYTGIVRNYVDRENNWNFKAYRMRLNPTELIDTLFTLHQKDRYNKIGIETTIYLQALKPFLEEEQRKRNTFLPIVELDHHQIHKETRIRGLIPRYQSGSIYHIAGECNDLEEELSMFPKAINDDVSDAAAYQLQVAEPPEKEEPLPETEDYNEDIY